ncbi:MAG: hypothetical protein WCL18_06420 [bacterium]
METREIKLARLQRELEKEKRSKIWGVLIMSLLVIVVMMCLYHYSSREKTVFGGILYVGMICVIVYYIFHHAIKELNMERCLKDIQYKIQTEGKFVGKIKEEYNHLVVTETKLNEIPPKLRKTVIYLLSNPDKTPEEIIQTREEEIENMKDKRTVYFYSLEETFWQYFISWEWLKKIPQ